MSILINMEMPKCCAECDVEGHYENYNGDEYGFFFPFGYKAYTEKTRDAKRLDNCPLIPVPPHGDLIDRGYAIATACSGRIRSLPTTEDGENWIRVEEVRESIKNAPTIIPAEEGER